MIQYLIDNIDLKTYGVRVSDTEGLFDLPKMKKPLSVNWPDRHGEQVDVSQVRFEPRDITISCYMIAQGRTEFLIRVNEFAAGLLMSTGLKQLVVVYDSNKPLTYMVYMPDGLNIKRSTKWNAARHTGVFELKLREPEPVKKVLRFTALTGNMQVSLAFASNRQVTVHWGNKKSTATNTPSVSLTHTYQVAGTYYIVLTGVIEDINNLVTNATIIWELI